jgi:two-component system, NarL family, response regulator YdfI
VLVVAASPAVRVGLAAVLASQPGLTVLESTARPAELGDAVESIEPDVVVLALGPGDPLVLPAMASSPDAAVRSPPVLVIGDDPAAGWVGRALRSGARGALPRTASTDQIVSAVLAVSAGLVVREPINANTPAQRVQTALDTAVPSLTRREIEILGLLAEGLGNRAIATRLAISEHTVKSHITSIFTKLDVSTRAEAVADAARLGLIML